MSGFYRAIFAIDLPRFLPRPKSYILKHRYFSQLLVAFISLIFVIESSSFASDNCSRYLVQEKLDQVFGEQHPSEETQKAFNAVKLALENGKLDLESTSSAFSKLHPGVIAKLNQYDTKAFDLFYRQLFQAIDPNVLVKQSAENPLFSYSIIEEPMPWLQFLKPETIGILLGKLAHVVRACKTPDIGIALSSQFGTLLELEQPQISRELDEIVQWMISKPTFLKNSAYFDSFSDETKLRIEEEWGYRAHSEDEVVLECDLFDSKSYEKSGRYCGTCDQMPATFFQAIMSKFENIRSTQAILVKAGREPIGLIKRSGDRSFLALRNVRNSQGRLILVKGGVYGTHSSIGDNPNTPFLNLKDIPKSKRLFYPLTFMRSLDGNFSKKRFRGFISDLEKIAISWKPQKAPPRPEVPAYLSEWQQSKDKVAYLQSLNSHKLFLLMMKAWDQIPNGETLLDRLDSKSLAELLIDKWNVMRVPDQSLQKLATDDLVEVLIAKWTSISDPESYLRSLTEYDQGKILTRNWFKIQNPESLLDQISDPVIKQRVLRYKNLTP